MATVFIPAQLRELASGVEQVEIQAATLRDVIVGLEAQFPGIRARLCRGDAGAPGGDAIAPGLAVSIDGAIVSKGMLSPVKPQSEVHFLPAIGGG